MAIQVANPAWEHGRLLEPRWGTWAAAGAQAVASQAAVAPFLGCGVGIAFGVTGSATRSAEPGAVYLGRVPGLSPKEIRVA